MDHDAYKKIVQKSRYISFEWRKVSAPQRGEIITQFGDELRVRKKALA